MNSDLEQVEAIVRAAAGKTIGEELAFTFPEIVDVITRCTENEIAVLGVEVFEARSAGYLTANLSDYDQRIGRGPSQRTGWADYVKLNNHFAKEFVKLHPSGDDHFYVLTAASWKEFSETNDPGLRR